MNRAISYYLMGEYEKALHDAFTYRDMGHVIPPQFLEALYDALGSESL
jgi:hypothetical protein